MHARFPERGKDVLSIGHRGGAGIAMLSEIAAIVIVGIRQRDFLLPKNFSARTIKAENRTAQILGFTDVFLIDAVARVTGNKELVLSLYGAGASVSG